MSFVKLSFEAQTQLFVDYHAWIGSKFNPNSIRIRLDVLDNCQHIELSSTAEADFQGLTAYYLFKVHADKRQFAEVDPYGWWVAVVIISQPHMVMTFI